MGTSLSTNTAVDLSLTVVSLVDSPCRTTLSLQDEAGVPLLASAPAVDIAPRGKASLGASFVVPPGAFSIEALIVSRFADQNQPSEVFVARYSVR
jgi:hypothetical protein